MSVRVGSATTFGSDAAHQSMMAGYEMAQRNYWLSEARLATGSEAFLRPLRIRNAIDAHRQMMGHIRRAKQAGAK